ncbi:MAG: helix-turn-helix domain-containing protein, partial [Anaerorhabdus sp.]
VADKLGISSYYVCKLLSMSEHKTFIDLLNAKRVDEAKKLLMKNERIKDITFEVGFQSPTYFARVFKKNEGITPKEYKAKFIIEQYYTQML